MPHAFAAAPGCDADPLIGITPGAERFGYFRHPRHIAPGELSPESLPEVQERYGNHFLNSAVREKRR
jgi:hypothetical protein